MPTLKIADDDKLYTVTVEFTDGAPPVTSSGIDPYSVNGLYSIIGDDGSRARLWTDDDRLVMFPGRFIRTITATEYPAE